MVSLEKPPSFQPKFTATGCFTTCGNEIVLLLRQDHKPQGGTWGVPGGKVEANENPDQAVVRELFEETGIRPTEPPRLLKTTYTYQNGPDFIFVMYALELAEKPVVILDPLSHKDYLWIDVQKTPTLSLMPDLDNHIRLFLELS
ncbi:NUDIX hydrolase [Patescibacteria group bacterium]|nr:NUDIX hydrolase [Patescibacteria group bacterium]